MKATIIAAVAALGVLPSLAVAEHRHDDVRESRSYSRVEVERSYGGRYRQPAYRAERYERAPEEDRYYRRDPDHEVHVRSYHHMVRHGDHSHVHHHVRRHVHHDHD